MSASFDLDPVERITAGAIGEPGERTFFLQARAGLQLITLLVEKEQMRILAQALLQLLAQLPDREEGEEPEDLELEEPLDPTWRAGDIAIAYDELADRIAIVMREALEEEEEKAPSEPATARLVVTREQAHAMAAHAIVVVAAGRPRCQLCGAPIVASEQHACPSMNGHRKFKE